MNNTPSRAPRGTYRKSRDGEHRGGAADVPTKAERRVAGAGLPGRWPRTAVVVVLATILLGVADAGIAGSANGRRVDGDAQSAQPSRALVDAHGEGIETLRIDGRTTIVRTMRDAGHDNGAHDNGSGGLVNGDFADGLNGWTVVESGGGSMPGQVLPDTGQALMLEGDSFLVSLQQSFVNPSAAQTLTFELDLDPGFDLTAGFIPDAFEVSLLDQNNAPVVPTWDSLATSSFNMQEDQSVNLGAGTTWNGATVTIDIRNVAPGTQVTLFFDFIGGDSDTAGGVRLDNAVVDVIVPAASQWGVVILAVLLMTTGTILFGAVPSENSIGDIIRGREGP